MTVTTGGLGAAIVAPGAANDCEHPPSTAASAIPLRVSQAGTPLSVFIPSDVLPDGATIDGKIVAFNAQMRAESSVKVRGEDDWPLKLSKWLLLTLVAGITIPALFTLQLGYVGYLAQQRWRDRRDARKAFDAANASPPVAAQLDQVFNDFVPTLDKNERDNPVKWGQDLNWQLIAKQQFALMPEPERTLLITALQRGDRERARGLLARLYPLWKTRFLHGANVS